MWGLTRMWGNWNTDEIETCKEKNALPLKWSSPSLLVGFLARSQCYNTNAWKYHGNVREWNCHIWLLFLHLLLQVSRMWNIVGLQYSTWWPKSFLSHSHTGVRWEDGYVNYNHYIFQLGHTPWPTICTLGSLGAMSPWDGTVAYILGARVLWPSFLRWFTSSGWACGRKDTGIIPNTIK